MHWINVRSWAQSSRNNNINIHATLLQYHAMNNGRAWLMIDTLIVECRYTIHAGIDILVPRYHDSEKFINDTHYFRNLGVDVRWWWREMMMTWRYRASFSCRQRVEAVYESTEQLMRRRSKQLFSIKLSLNALNRRENNKRDILLFKCNQSLEINLRWILINKTHYYFKI